MACTLEDYVGRIQKHVVVTGQLFLNLQMIHHHLSRQQSFVILLFGPTSVTPSLNDVFFVSLFFILFVFVRGIGKVKGLTVSLAHFL